MSPDSMIKTAGLLAIAASSIIIITNTVVNGRCFVYCDADNDQRKDFVFDKPNCWWVKVDSGDDKKLMKRKPM